MVPPKPRKNQEVKVQKFECIYCKKDFIREKSLEIHKCIKKQRFEDSSLIGNRMGFSAYSRYYEVSHRRKNLTIDDFINSEFYMEFVKFGNYAAELKPLYFQNFIDYLIRSKIRLVDWRGDAAYEGYIIEMYLRESVDVALERTISELQEWASKNNTDYTQYFKQVSPFEASAMIRKGKLSPWVLYLSTTGSELFSKLTEDHMKFIGKYINASLWMPIFRSKPEDVQFVQDLLSSAGI